MQQNLSKLTRSQALRGHHGSAMSHITSGVKILSEIHANASGSSNHGALAVSAHPYVELRTLEVLFARLDAGIVQASVF